MAKQFHDWNTRLRCQLWNKMMDCKLCDHRFNAYFSWTDAAASNSGCVTNILKHFLWQVNQILSTSILYMTVVGVFYFHSDGGKANTKNRWYYKLASMVSFHFHKLIPSCDLMVHRYSWWWKLRTRRRNWDSSRFFRRIDFIFGNLSFSLGQDVVESDHEAAVTCLDSKKPLLNKNAGVATWRLGTQVWMTVASLLCITSAWSYQYWRTTQTSWSRQLLRYESPNFFASRL